MIIAACMGPLDSEMGGPHPTALSEWAYLMNTFVLVLTKENFYT